jgi:AcrR family transcriptional regulator
MTRSVPAAARRLTQEQRSSSTIAKLMDATIESLSELGYANTTTTVVAERAGVSRGAQLHHFPAKSALVTSAVEYLAVRRIEEFRKRAAALPQGGDRVSMAIDLIWSTFSGPLFYAAVELWVAARTDSGLHAILYEMERQIGKAIAAIIQESFGDFAGSPRARDSIQLTLYMMRGMALERILKNDDTERGQLLSLWKELMVRTLDAPAAKAGG